MKKLLSAILVIVMAASCMFTLSSCLFESVGGSITPDELFSYVEPDAEKLYSTPSGISQLVNMEIVCSNENLLYFKNTYAEPGAPKEIVLNTKSGNIVKTVTKEGYEAEYSSTVLQNCNYSLIVENTYYSSQDSNGSYKTTLYTENGQLIASATSKYGYESVRYISCDHYEFDDKLIYYRDGVATVKLEAGFRDIPYFDYATDTHYYELYDDELIVYDSELRVTFYYAPFNDDFEINGIILENGNLIIQEFIELPEHETDYDFIADGVKVGYDCYLANIENGDITELDCDFLVVDFFNKIYYPEIEEEGVNTDVVVNAAAIYRIANGRVSENEEFVLISNEGKVTARLDNNIPGQYGIAVPIAEDRFLAEDKAGKEYIVNGKGEIISEVTNASFDSETGLFCMDDKYYNTDLELVFDMNSIDYYKVGGTWRYEIYRKTVNEDTSDGGSIYKYYILRGGEMTEVFFESGAESFVFSSTHFAYIYTVQTDSGIKYYKSFRNIDGSEIYTVETSAESYIDVYCYNYDDCLVFAYTYYNADGDREVSYRVACRK